MNSATLGQVLSLGGGGETYSPGQGSFYSGGAWQRPALSALTQANTGGSAPAVIREFAGGPIQMRGAGSQTWRALGVNPGNSTGWTATFLLKMTSRGDLANSIGVLVANTATGNFMPFYYYFTGNPAPTIYVDHSSGLGSGGTYVSHQVNKYPDFSDSSVAMQIQVGGGVVEFALSNDPLDENSFMPFYSETVAGYLAATDFVGFGFLDASFSQAPPIVAMYGMTVTTP